MKLRVIKRCINSFNQSVIQQDEEVSLDKLEELEQIGKDLLFKWIRGNEHIGDQLIFEIAPDKVAERFIQAMAKKGIKFYLSNNK